MDVIIYDFEITTVKTHVINVMAYARSWKLLCNIVPCLFGLRSRISFRCIPNLGIAVCGSYRLKIGEKVVYIDFLPKIFPKIWGMVNICFIGNVHHISIFLVLSQTNFFRYVGSLSCRFTVSLYLVAYECSQEASIRDEKKTFHRGGSVTSQH